MEILTKILSASIELFRQYGFKTITMDDIARKAGISKKTLYQHFANKNEVVSETITWYQAKISASCISMMEESGNPIEAMVRIIGLFDQVMQNMNPLVMLELERFYPEGYQKFRCNLMEKDIEAIKQNILWGIKEGLYREKIDPDFTARFRMELSMLAFQPNLIVNTRRDLRYVATEVSELFLYGIMTPKGEKLYQKYKEQYLKQVSNYETNNI